MKRKKFIELSFKYFKLNFIGYHFQFQLIQPETDSILYEEQYGVALDQNIIWANNGYKGQQPREETKFKAEISEGPRFLKKLD